LLNQQEGATTIHHIDEIKLEEFVARPDRFAEAEQSEILQHLHACALCREYVERVRSFQRDVEQQLTHSPSALDQEKAKLLSRQAHRASLPSSSSEKLLGDFSRLFHPSQLSYARIVHYVRQHPLKSTTYTAGLAALLVGLLLVINRWPDKNPSYAVVQNHTLFVYNQSNEVIWTKNVEGFPDFPKLPPSSDRKPVWLYDASYYLKLDDGDRAVPVKVFDIDGDQKNEVLISSGVIAGYSVVLSPDSLYCFNADGTLRWIYAPDRRGIKFGAADFSQPSNWHIRRFIRIQKTANKNVQLFVLSTHLPSWPTRVAELDPPSGKELRTYWHTGGLTTAVVTDLEGDGTSELVLAGINNAFNKVCIAVFDPDEFGGVGPTSDLWKPVNLPAAKEKYYVLLPKVEGLPSSIPYNVVAYIQAPDAGGLFISTNEAIFDSWKDQSHFGGIVYTFGPRMEVTNVIAGSPFEKSLERAKREGFAENLVLDEQFYSRLKQSVMYWDKQRSQFVPHDEFHKLRPLP
jgi:hypothetical protein